jgi:hypothetical protein
MTEAVARPDVSVDDFENHFGAQVADTRASDAWELFGDSMREGVFQRFLP